MKRAILGVSLGLALLLAAIAPAHGAPASELLTASQSGDFPAADRALRAGADPAEAKDENGNNALHWAAWHGHTAIVTLLLEAGADVDAIDGLVMPAVVLLGSAMASETEAREAAQKSVRVTRSSKQVEAYVGELSTLLRAILRGESAPEVATAAARRVGMRLDPSMAVPVVACYIDQNWASLLLLLTKRAYLPRTPLR